MIPTDDRPSRLRRGLQAAFLLACAATLWLALSPAPPRPPSVLGWDKLQHLAAFAVLAALGAAAFPRRRAILLIAGLVAFGALIELLQMIPALGREAALADLVADAAGTLAGVAPGLLLRRRIAPVHDSARRKC